jgi:hypothetical protein
MNSLLNSIVSKVAADLQLDKKFVLDVYKSYFKFIRFKLSEGIDLSNSTTFKETAPNFNIPYLGKLYGDVERFNNFKNRENKKNNVTDKEN